MKKEMSLASERAGTIARGGVAAILIGVFLTVVIVFAWIGIPMILIGVGMIIYALCIAKEQPQVPPMEQPQEPQCWSRRLDDKCGQVTNLQDVPNLRV